MECCGIRGPSDWDGLLDSSREETVVPDSCCSKFDEMDTDNCETYHEIGCYPRLNFIISQSAMLIATGATTVAFVQFLGVICAFMLAKTIRRTKSVREARRWQLNQSLGIMINPFSMDAAKPAAAPGERQYDPNPEYTQMEASQKANDAAIYLPTSPSVI